MNLSLITEQVCALSEEVSSFIKNESEKFNLDSVEDKGLNQLVSYVDITAENKIVEGLKNILPESGFLTEEETKDSFGEKYTWVIDPLDGTTNFIHSLPVFATSIALLEDKTPIMGVIYEVNSQECFYAWQNGGAWMNGKRIHMSSIDSLQKSLLATGFPYYDFDGMKSYLTVLNKFMKSTHGLRRMGSAAVDLAYTSCGRFEGFFEYGLNPWDIAAGICLIKEAGGIVSDFEGGDDYLFGKVIIAANSHVHEEMVKVINDEFNK
jgi:myo-inositol-1(or 4)-monophosphatase